MSKLPKILVSSVIRSTNRGDSHGGLYVVDLEQGSHEQVLDWKYDHINWDSGGGDRGLRGLAFYKGELYAAGARSIFVFDKNYNLVRQYRHNLIAGTHELFIYNDILFSISNEYDVIMTFDLKTNQWIYGFQHTMGLPIAVFDTETPMVPDMDEKGDVIMDENDPTQPKWTMLPKEDTLHIDSVSVYNNWMFYSGSKVDHLYALNLQTREHLALKLFFPFTHNAQPWKDGVAFNRSVESDTCYQVQNALVKHWKTPAFPTPVKNYSYDDHARIGYTRGMVLTKDHVIVGTSPASVHAYSLDSDLPVQSVYLSDDVRNSVCGMCAIDPPEESHVKWSL